MQGRCENCKHVLYHEEVHIVDGPGVCVIRKRQTKPITLLVTDDEGNVSRQEAEWRDLRKVVAKAA